ncbi:hypothetical protein H0H81_005199 [Sphagnurus paluster]|uniref:SAP domain-containing protein n=1 Tax=Sphagnurus paluster TaxID=117069 RepID=A0A9P7FUD0_9AGAR|nr:hypothetical protein H0H81_005199 [Sphagnurus paluster]
MSTTTQILFNSPALHSLKRDQLVKLCKIHSLKASGKNTELIEKLKRHAETLPRDAPLRLAARRDEGDVMDEGDADHTMDEGQSVDSQSANARWGFQMPRPSEQWEVVMEDIEEMEERGSSQGTLNSLRTVGGGSSEFGTAMSKSSSVSSSIKALASSFGLKRGKGSKSTMTSSSSFPSSSSSKSMLYLNSLPSKDEELANSTPYSSLPEADTLPQTDHFTFEPAAGGVDRLGEPPAPLPGHSLRPGMPAPENARLSLGLNVPATPTRKEQPTTTIRLISNNTTNHNQTSYGRTPQLKPFKTSFDIILGSPEPATGGFRGVSLWPSGDKDKGIYPPLPLDDLMLPSSAPVPNVTDKDLEMPGSLDAASRPTTLLTPGPSNMTASTPNKTLAVPVPEPFVFGSPLPQHNVSNEQFKDAAASVLEEMNKRLKEEGVEGVGMDLIGRLKEGAPVPVLAPRVGKQPSKGLKVKEKFDELHAEEFSKMEGIDAFVKRRGMAGAGRESTALAGQKRKSSVGHGAGRDRFGRRIGCDAASGRISTTRVIRRQSRVIPGSFDEDSDAEEERDDEVQVEGKRLRVDSSAMVEDVNTKTAEEEEKVKAEEEERRQKEKEAIRRKLELNKARRKSSVGGAGARGRVSVGRGGAIGLLRLLGVIELKPQAKPSRFGFLSSAKSLVQKVWNGGKTAAASESATAIPKPAVKAPIPVPTVPAPAPPQKKLSSVSNARPSTATNPPARIASLDVEKEKTAGTASSRSRSPLPSFGPSSTTRTNLMKPTRTSSIVGTGLSSKTGNGVSSMGTRTSMTSSSRMSTAGGIGSMGTKHPPTGIPARAPTSTSTGAGSSSSRMSSSRLSSSRLLAPTASSLAKTTRPSVSGSGSGSSLKIIAQTKGSNTETPGIGTNTPGTPNAPWSPRPGGIFSKPLSMPSGIPTPVKKRTAEASTVAAPADQSMGDDTGSTSMGVPPARQRSITGRKPRISRSKVIAKLASQRAGGTGVVGQAGGTPAARGTGRMRSSLGAKVQRSSLGGKPGATKGGESVMMSAKKRVRQSEFARRRSKVAPIDLAGGSSSHGQAMDVDAE